MTLLTISLQPVHRSYEAPVINTLLKWARVPRSWWGTNPSMLSVGGIEPSSVLCRCVPGFGGDGARFLQKSWYVST